MHPPSPTYTWLRTVCEAPRHPCRLSNAATRSHRYGERHSRIYGSPFEHSRKFGRPAFAFRVKSTRFLSRQVTSSTVECPDLVRKQLRPAVPKPDTPRPLAKAGSKAFPAPAALIEEKPAGAGEGDDVSDAAAAAVLASSSGEMKGEDVGGEDGKEGVDEAEDAKDGEGAEEGRRIPPR